jgi:hypothetical protein
MKFVTERDKFMVGLIHAIGDLHKNVVFSCKVGQRDYLGDADTVIFQCNRSPYKVEIKMSDILTYGNYIKYCDVYSLSTPRWIKSRIIFPLRYGVFIQDV